MINKIIIWNKDEYGFYTGDNVLKLFHDKKYIVNYECNREIINKGSTYMNIKDHTYEIYGNIIDFDTYSNFVFVYPRG